jgi:hypothetical protein
MIPADLDELERQYASDDLHDAADMHFAFIVHAPDLIRLARRGLRAEREVCGTCKYYGRSHCRMPDHYCSEWVERGGGE